MKILNLGILAHVDAGKTSLTERLLFTTGVIDSMGSVDQGSTQTDALALERQRGITIKSAVASFAIDDLAVNLIDTPGHPDFIAEVERVLRVLDGVVLVISAVEGVQAQTRVLMRTLQRLQIPTLLFINKLDRRGVDTGRVMSEIASRLTPAAIALGGVQNEGTADACYAPYQADDAAFRSRLIDILSQHDDRLLAMYLEDQAIAPADLRRALVEQTGLARIHPLLCGSAITGTGVDSLLRAIRELLPSSQGDPGGALAGTVFKIDRGAAGEKVAYVRLFEGTVRVRDRLATGVSGQGRVTAIQVFDRGSIEPRPAVAAGQIARVWGLGDIRIGDALGPGRSGMTEHFFVPPTLETIVVPRHAAERHALHAALSQLAEADPLINLRLDEMRQELFLSLYGEVQKEVIQATLANDYGIEVEFRESSTICIERPIGSGAALELLGKPSNPFLATVGLRVEPAPVGTGVEFVLAARVDALPLFVYRSADEFSAAMRETVLDTLRQGLYGWQVSDCQVIMTESGYVSPETTTRDFRLLTPLVLMRALREARTVVCEPVHSFQMDVPADTLGRVLSALARLRAVLRSSTLRGTAYRLDGTIPAAQVHALQGQLAGLTHGEGVLESAFAHYQPLRDTYPTRARTDNNPLNHKQYLLHVLRRV